MNDAYVIGQKGGAGWFVRSDAIAAKMMQKAIAAKGGEGSNIKVMRAEAREAMEEMRDARREARAERMLERREAREAEKSERVAAAKEIDAPHEIAATRFDASLAFGADRAESIAMLREKVAEMSRALESLNKAMDAIGEFKFLIAESDSASAVAFAGQVLADMRAEAAVKAGAEAAETAEVDAETGVAEDITEEIGETEEAPLGADGSAADDDVMTLTGTNVSHIYGGEGDDTITINAETISNVYGGTGNDYMVFNSQIAEGIKGGDGDDFMEITAAHIEEVSDGKGDDTVSITARTADNILLGDGDDVFNLEVAGATVSLWQGNGRDTFNLRDAAVVEFFVGDNEDLINSATTHWNGDDLLIEFTDEDAIVINNAANAGGLTIRSDKQVINLLPQLPLLPAESLLDVSL